MTQRVIAARDVDLYINYDAIGIAYKITTASNFSATITGNTEDIGAISTDEPIATDNGGNTYDVTFALQQAEANDIKDALSAATANNENGAIVHIRQIVEAATITVQWHKKRDVPAKTITETYNNVTGVEESDAVERRSTETIKNWHFRARGMSRVTTLT